MSGFSTSNNEHLIRSNLWSRDLKQILEDDLFAMRYVKMITDFPDGDTLNIPSIGQAEVLDYVEGEAVKYSAMDTGNFTFTINKYKQSGTYITEKMKQDSYVMSELMASFVPKQNRAIMKQIESDVLNIGPDGQVSGNQNLINGGAHRRVGTGANNQIVPQDFAAARYALLKANVPMTDLVAIVDPSVEYNLSTLTNLSNISFNPRWEGIVRTGMSTGMQFLMNIYGFDVYMSQNLKTGIAETLTGQAGNPAVTSGVANLFFSATRDVLPFVGLLRQAPKVDSEYNKDHQREEFVTTCRYGFKLFRPENLVVILSDVPTI